MTAAGHEILSLALNFALPQRKLPVNEILASTELTARQLDHRSAQQLRQNLKTSLNKYKPPTSPTLSQHNPRAIASLRKDDSIVILPADKGNSTVVTNRIEYNDKVNDTLKDGTYRLLKKDPTAKLERTIERLKALEKKENHPATQLPSTVVWITEDPQTRRPTPPHCLLDRLSHIQPG